MGKRYFLFVAGFLLALNIFVWKEVFALAGPEYLKVDFLDVGQGDSAFIETPENHQILIDGGPSSAVLQKLAERMPFWDKTIDVVILTHPEKDHMAGILEVLKRYKVKYFLWTGVVKNDAENKQLAELLNRAETRGISQNNFLATFLPRGKKPYATANATNTIKNATKVITVSAGERIKSGNVLIDALFPLENLSGKELKNTSNDTCVVLKLVFGKSSFLFACDISSSGERKILDAGENVKADVLKVAHHGSKYSTSEEFLQAVNPKTAVIEVGKNSYGHPTEEVLQRLQNFGIQIKRTDINGDIKFVSDGKNIKIIN